MEKLTEYERQRLENIKRNDQMMAALKIHSTANQLSSTIKRRRSGNKKSYKVSPVKKPKIETPIVIRRSLRTRGISPDSPNANLVKDDLVKPQVKKRFDSPKKTSPTHLGPISMKDAHSGDESDRPLIERVLSVSDKDLSCDGKDMVVGNVDLGKWSLEEENVARVMPGRIFTVKWFPSREMNMVVAGNKFGNVAFWDVDGGKEEDKDGIYLYGPHSGPVSGISIQPFSLSKVITSCYDGFIRLMDIEKEVFDLLYSGNEAIFSLSQGLENAKSVCFSEGHGKLNIWDERAGKSSSSWILHEDRINSIDFNPGNPNIMATSSTDGTACIWDLRRTRTHKPNSLKIVNHERAVHSAYFSPSGSHVATTSLDNTVGIIGGANYGDISMIYHDNQTGRWISSFKGIWGWDDSHVFIGNMKRGIDVLTATSKKPIATLKSEQMTAIPCRFAAHPCKVGILAGATSGGQVYIWTSS